MLSKAERREETTLIGQQQTASRTDTVPSRCHPCDAETEPHSCRSIEQNRPPVRMLSERLTVWSLQPYGTVPLRDNSHARLHLNCTLLDFSVHDTSTGSSYHVSRQPKQHGVIYFSRPSGVQPCPIIYPSLPSTTSPLTPPLPSRDDHRRFI